MNERANKIQAFISSDSGPFFFFGGSLCRKVAKWQQFSKLSWKCKLMDPHDLRQFIKNRADRQKLLLNCSTSHHSATSGLQSILIQSRSFFKFFCSFEFHSKVFHPLQFVISQSLVFRVRGCCLYHSQTAIPAIIYLSPSLIFLDYLVQVDII